MKEKDFISVIKEITGGEYIGDDCAYLKDLNIVVTQDSLVEGIHFSLDYTTPFELGYKSVMVNLSDVAASGAKAMYLTISLSVPADIDTSFIKEFYKGAKSACGYTVKIAGGDITGAGKIFISVCAIGNAADVRISSRKNAKFGYKIVVSGLHGSSAAGLKLLIQGRKHPEKFIKAHLMPIAQTDFAGEISRKIDCDYAMMDTSDGLMDALSAIANESSVSLDIDFDKIPFDNDLKQFENWRELVLFGGEDYKIIAAVPDDFDCNGTVIGHVKQGSGIDLKINGCITHYSKEDIDNKIFDHFKNGEKK